MTIVRCRKCELDVEIEDGSRLWKCPTCNQSYLRMERAGNSIFKEADRIRKANNEIT